MIEEFITFSKQESQKLTREYCQILPKKDIQTLFIDQPSNIEHLTSFALEKVISNKTDESTNISRKIDGQLLYQHQSEIVGTFESHETTSDLIVRSLVQQILDNNAINHPDDFKIDLSKLNGLQMQLNYHNNLQNNLQNNTILTNTIQSFNVDLSISQDPILRAIQGDFTLYYCGELPDLNANRLVITPSFDCYQHLEGSNGTYLLPRNNVTTASDLWTKKPTCHIILVQPYQKIAYINQFCSKGFIVATLPNNNEESIGSARYWSTILAKALNQRYFIMLDDSYDANYQEVIQVWDMKQNQFHKMPLEFGVEYLESLFVGSIHSFFIGIISLSCYQGKVQSNNLITIDTSQGFQLINVDSTMKKGIFFRRYLSFGENLLFSQTCLQNNLLSLQCQHVQFVDNNIQYHVANESNGQNDQEDCQENK